jgi:hypothetical protein
VAGDDEAEGAGSPGAEASMDDSTTTDKRESSS